MPPVRRAQERRHDSDRVRCGGSSWRSGLGRGVERVRAKMGQAAHEDHASEKSIMVRRRLITLLQSLQTMRFVKYFGWTPPRVAQNAGSEGSARIGRPRRSRPAESMGANRSLIAGESTFGRQFRLKTSASACFRACLKAHVEKDDREPHIARTSAEIEVRQCSFRHK